MHILQLAQNTENVLYHYTDPVAAASINIRNEVLVGLVIGALLLCAVAACVFAIVWANCRSRQSRRVTERYVCTVRMYIVSP